MKKNFIWGLMAASAFIFSSCQKDAGVNAPDSQQIGRSSGVVADDPALLAKVPLTVSYEFMQNGGFASSVNSNTASRGSTKPSRDNTAPSVAITSPANGSSVSGTVTISISASDNVGISSVLLSINGGLYKSWTSGSYSTTWTPNADGNYTLTATAKDAAGNSSSHSIVVSKSTTIVVNPPTTTTLPSSFIMATPAVMNQGGEGSCLSVALNYQRSIEAYYSSGASAYSNASNFLSPEFLYNNTKVNSGCGSGASMLTSMSFIKNKGICTWNSLPYSDQNGCDTTMITASMKNEALNYKIAGYHYMLSTDMTAIKTALANRHPLSFAFQMDANFYNAYPGYIWNSRGTLMYTHALTLVGYDDSKKAFKAINGWGTSWGDQGFIWIDYTFFGTIAGYVYQMD